MNVKGIDQLLTPEDIAVLIKRPVRFVREKLLKPHGVLKSVKFGGNSYRVRPVDFAEFLAKGQTGFRGSRSSGRWSTAE